MKMNKEDSKIEKKEQLLIDEIGDDSYKVEKSVV